MVLISEGKKWHSCCIYGWNQFKRWLVRELRVLCIIGCSVCSCSVKKKTGMMMMMMGETKSKPHVMLIC